MFSNSNISTSNKVRIVAFVIALLVIMTTLWHFCFIGFCHDSKFCEIMLFVIAATGYDIIAYLWGYCKADPNKPRNKMRTLIGLAIKVLMFFAAVSASVYFSAQDVVIKHAPTFLVEFVTIFNWFVIFTAARLKIDRHLEKKAHAHA